MSLVPEFQRRLPAPLKRTFVALQSPIDIQRYLDGLKYVGEERDRCPLDVMKDGQCHCLDGGLLGALALRHIGDSGLLIDLVPVQDARGRNLDDDHVLAVFRRHGRWGALAKSNYPWLRYREPVYYSLHELVMSYFDVYISANFAKSLRGYTRPLDIARYDHLAYAWDEEGAGMLYKKFYARKPIRLLLPESEALLVPADQRTYDSAFLGSDPRWLYHPKERSEANGNQ